MDFSGELLLYLQRSRDAFLWKLDGLSEYDARRPLTPTGSNILGIVKHVLAVEAGYLGECFGRPFPGHVPWAEDDAEDGSDMWARADESRESIVTLYRQVWAHSDETVRSLPLDTPGTVPWWPEEHRHPTLHRLLVHICCENDRHLGQVDILRETLDGAIGHRPDSSNLPPAFDWPAYVATVQAAADTFR